MPSFKAGWRPAMAWVFIAGWALTVLTVLGLLWLKTTSLADASGLLIALVAGGAAPVTTYVFGRTAEKREGVAEVPGTDFPPPDIDVTHAPPVADERGLR